MGNDWRPCLTVDIHRREESKVRNVTVDLEESQRHGPCHMVRGEGEMSHKDLISG